MKKIFVFLLIAFASIYAIAQQATFTSVVSKNKLALQERFELSITLSNGSSVKEFKAPLLNDFYILGGPNQSSSISITNGRTSQSITYSYVLQAKNTGKYTIGSASVKTGGNTLTTLPITIEVTENPVPSQNQQSSVSSASEDVYSYLKQNVFIKTEVSDADVYKGESVLLTHKLYVKRNSSIYGYKILQAVKTPKYEGFYVEDIEVPESQAMLEVVNGEYYNVSILKKTMLTAQKSATLDADPMTLDAIFGIQIKEKKKSSRDPFDIFDDFFSDPFNSNSREIHYSLSSPSIKINARELPAGAPSDFNGAVGRFTMKSELNDTSAVTDEPLTYRITISGVGNLNLFNAPQLILPPRWETYDPKTSTNNNSKAFEYLLIPRSPGQFTIPSFSWSYFDPNRKQYVSLSSEEYPVRVQAGAGYSPSANNYGVNKEDIELLARDIRFIKTEKPAYIRNDKQFFGSPLFIAGLGFPFIGVITLLIFSSRKKQLESDLSILRHRNANSAAKKRLSKALNFSKSNETKLFYNEIVRATWGYLSGKLNIPQGELSKENIYGYLQKAHVNEATVNDVLRLLDDCELALFAPQIASGSTQEAYNSAMALITKLEDEIQK